MLRTATRATTARGRLTLLLGAALAAGGAVWHYPLLLALGGLLVALVVAEVVSVLGAGTLGVRREIVPRVVARHGACEGRLEVTGRRRSGLVRTDVAELVDGVPLPVRLPDVRHRDGVSVAYPVPTPRRGLLDVGPLLLRRYGLAGMAARTVEAGTVDQVRVLPRRIPVHTMLTGHRRAAAGGDDSLELGGTDLVGLHEYTMGDDLRRLHWATTARTGTLMVREDAEPSEPHLCVLLDDRAESYGHPDEFEDAVELAAAIAGLGVASGRPTRLRLVTGREEIVVAGSASHRPRHETRDIDWLLAEVQPLTGAPTALPGSRDLDVVVLASGSALEPRDQGLLLGDAPTRVVALVDPRPAVGAAVHDGVLVLRGPTSVDLASRWDAVAT